MGKNWPCLLFLHSKILVLLRNQDDKELKSRLSVMLKGFYLLKHIRVAAEFSVLTSPCSSHFQPMGTNETFFHKFPLCVEITHFN